MTASAGICVVLGPARVDDACRRARRPRPRTRSPYAAEHVVEEVDVGVGGGAEDRRARRRPRSASRTAASERRPPPTCTGTPSSRAIRSTCSQVRRARRVARAVEVDDVQRSARPRSTQRAGGVERVGVVDGLARRSRPARSRTALPSQDVDRRVEDHAGRGHGARSSREVAPAARSPCARGLLGVELHAEERRRARPR